MREDITGNAIGVEESGRRVCRSKRGDDFGGKCMYEIDEEGRESGGGRPPRGCR